MKVSPFLQIIVGVLGVGCVAVVLCCSARVGLLGWLCCCFVLKFEKNSVVLSSTRSFNSSGLTLTRSESVNPLELRDFKMYLTFDLTFRFGHRLYVASNIISVCLSSVSNHEFAFAWIWWLFESILFLRRFFLEWFQIAPPPRPSRQQVKSFSGLWRPDKCCCFWRCWRLAVVDLLVPPTPPWCLGPSGSKCLFV